jgi:glutathione peroxidase-family protein
VEGNKHANKRTAPLYESTTAKERKDLKKEGVIDEIRWDKIAVLGLVERDGKVVAKRIPDTKAATIIPIIEKP